MHWRSVLAGCLLIVNCFRLTTDGVVWDREGFAPESSFEDSLG